MNLTITVITSLTSEEDKNLRVWMSLLIPTILLIRVMSLPYECNCCLCFGSHHS
ncbi:hypothetical protein GLYMA_06G186500v4 [Glycine max]|uniref:Uncharacterized protein n=1 Tax=Glycine max TaxID=3847 RepID=I1KCK9_SOYBN|nr:hypothetical protein GYH30_015541 [Glycine max]KRH54457.1 hypothetical protein GLYMA_06G186500v4 [Glycine max]